MHSHLLPKAIGCFRLRRQFLLAAVTVLLNALVLLFQTKNLSSMIITFATQVVQLRVPCLQPNPLYGPDLPVLRNPLADFPFRHRTSSSMHLLPLAPRPDPQTLPISRNGALTAPHLAGILLTLLQNVVLKALVQLLQLRFLLQASDSHGRYCLHARLLPRRLRWCAT